MLYILPTADYVNIPSTVMLYIAKQVDPEAVILWGNDATPENARKAVLDNNPPYVFTTGHGLPCVTTVQDKEPFISLAEPQMSPYCARELNLDIVAGRIWHVQSCWCGRQLAGVMVEKGAKAVFAHDNEYLFLIPPDGEIDVPTAAPFLAEYTVDVAMLAGRTAEEAQQARIAAYKKWEQYFTEGEGSKLKAGPLAARIVLADSMIAKLYGDKTARVPNTGEETEHKVALNLPLPLKGQPRVEGSAVLFLLMLPFLFGLGGGKGGEEE